MDKSELRTHFCTLRECLPAGDVAAASAALCQRLAAWLRGRGDASYKEYLDNKMPLKEGVAPTILTYLAFHNEPDLSLLFALLPDVNWIAPRIDKDRRLMIHPYDPAQLVRHRFGMLEPAANLPVVDPATVDVVLVPGVAFDRRGGRLGFGGGYYDRFLSTTPALRVGIAFDQCLVGELPCGEHDQRMDWVATPSEIIHCAPLWREACNQP
ncbi:MAG: 5-formyltetrahydrofolate cyclo-ligase [Anaerolineae bacterium]|nr:5-formyltetrahydrofolate cyclo-ligase [Anaerolineae bacterium]